MRPLLPCVARCSLLLAACCPFASAAVLCCPFALPGLLRWLPGWLLPNGVLQQRPCQPLRRSAPASNSFPMALRCSTPASNKPHPAEKSTPVWLAIWRIWAGFANSQLLPDAAALSSMQGLPRSGNSSAQTSASLHPPAALRLRCLPFTRDMGVHGLCGRVPDSAGNVSPWIESAQT